MRRLLLSLFFASCYLPYEMARAEDASSVEFDYQYLKPKSIAQPRPDFDDSIFGEESLSEGRVSIARVRLELARVLSYTRRFDEATEQYQELLRDKPSLHFARIELANVLHWQGKTDAIIDVLQKVPSEELGASGLALLGDIYAQKKNYKRSAELLQAVLDLEPERDAVRFKRAQVLSWDKQYQSAFVEFEKLLEKNSKDKQLRRNYARVLGWAGKHKEAAKQLQLSLGWGS